MRKLLIAILLLSGSSYAVEDGIDGPACMEGPIPILFGRYNRTAELAHGEKYLLVGTIYSLPDDKQIFEVNLEQHPWLKRNYSFQRVQYELMDLKEEWRRFIGREVVARVKAVGVVERNASTKYGNRYKIQLTLTSEPVDAKEVSYLEK